MRRLLIALLLAAPVAASAGELSVRLRQPLDGATLRGGSTAVIEWSGAALDPGIEEWEAFLSVDGGRYYAARITPHLDISLHEFRWTVPNVHTDDARILFRFGDEHHETVFELPHRFSIQPSRVTPHFGGTITRETGEPARPGDPGVASWVDSDRRGSHLQKFETRSDAMRSVREADREQDESESTTISSLQPGSGSSIPAPAGRNPRRPSSPPVTPDALLQSCRLNI